MELFERPVSFIATTDSAASRAFYETVLGLMCLSDDPYALVFDLGGATLRIQKVEAVSAVNYTVLGWEVLNIRHCATELGKKGLRFKKFSALEQDDLGIWVAPGGALVAWFTDPDGNTLSLTELPV